MFDQEAETQRYAARTACLSNLVRLGNLKVNLITL